LARDTLAAGISEIQAVKSSTKVLSFSHRTNPLMIVTVPASYGILIEQSANWAQLV
jgi:hypothetical protein